MLNDPDNKPTIESIAMKIISLNLQTEHSITETATMLQNFDFNACVGCEAFPCSTAILALEINCPIRPEYELHIPGITLAQYEEGVKFYDN